MHATCPDSDAMIALVGKTHLAPIYSVVVMVRHYKSKAVFRLSKDGGAVQVYLAAFSLVIFMDSAISVSISITTLLLVVLDHCIVAPINAKFQARTRSKVSLSGRIYARCKRSSVSLVGHFARPAAAIHPQNSFLHQDRIEQFFLS